MLVSATAAVSLSMLFRKYFRQAAHRIIIRIRPMPVAIITSRVNYCEKDLVGVAEFDGEPLFEGTIGSLMVFLAKSSTGMSYYG